MLIPATREADVSMTSWDTERRDTTETRGSMAPVSCHVMSCHVMSCPHVMSWRVSCDHSWQPRVTRTHLSLFPLYSVLKMTAWQSTDSWPHHHILISTYLKQIHCLCENYYLKLFEIESKSIMKWGLRSKWGNRRNYGHRRSSYKRVQFSSLNTYPIK